MERTRSFISENIDSLERYSGFRDHEIYYELIDKKLTPDNVIETCKALLEGICKTVLNQIDIRKNEVKNRFLPHEIKSLETTFQKMNGKAGEDFPALYRQTILVLSAFHHACEKDFLNKVGGEFCKHIARVRNADGPISHGQPSPKPNKNSKIFASMVIDVTDIIAFHMLDIFALIDFQLVLECSDQQAIVEAFRFKNDLELEVISERECIIREFNDALDEQFQLEGKPLYSRALYDQYLEDYEIQLQEFIDNKEQELME